MGLNVSTTRASMPPSTAWNGVPFSRFIHSGPFGPTLCLDEGVRRSPFGGAEGCEESSGLGRFICSQDRQIKKRRSSFCHGFMPRSRKRLGFQPGVLTPGISPSDEALQGRQKVSQMVIQLPAGGLARRIDRFCRFLHPWSSCAIRRKTVDSWIGRTCRSKRIFPVA